MSGEVFTGNILLFYAYDVGDEIHFDVIRKKKLLSERLVTLSPCFKNYNVPLSFSLPQFEAQDENVECIFSKLYRFGVVSLCYKVPFSASLEGLKKSLIELHDSCSKKSDSFAKKAFDHIATAVNKPYFYHLKNSYFVVQLNPLEGTTPELFRQQYGNTITSLLRLETEVLSGYQKKEIISSVTGYSGKDFTIIDSEASFIYDTEYAEVLEFFELANVQLLQLQYFDRLLNEKLEYFYSKPYTIPMRAYIPLLSSWLDTPISQLARLRVDISVITERLESSIYMAGDAYFSNFYSMLIEKLLIKEWKESIKKKLDIINDLYTVYQHRLEILHDEILTVVIIILIALEAGIAFMK